MGNALSSKIAVRRYPKKDCSFEDVLSGKISAEELASQLSDDELAKLLTADGSQKRKALGLENKELAVGEGTHTHPVKEWGIPASVMQDGPAGVRASAFANPVPPDDEIAGRDCICYPCATALAASWDIELMEEIGAAIRADLDKAGYNGLCAPGVNLHRNPRCGRNFEYFSEDPFLAAKMAIGEIRGIQQNADGSPTGKYAVLKHFAVNNLEDNRLVGDSVLSERCARELYLRVFEYVIKECEPLSIMTAYNKMNGIYTSAHPELVDGICRSEWGYGGWIMTDWSVYAHTVDCLKAGADTVMPGIYVPFEEMLERGLDRNTARIRAANLIRHLSRTEHYKP
ncbi:MAG: glycoside hydrolase family 3 protein [Ruminococcaceae bacterium]|nr:glycoside hydrolase family 3 protein [Oscillospiraceae bacterium]